MRTDGRCTGQRCPASVSVSLFVRQSKGVDNFGRDVDDVGGVEWLRREHRVVVVVRRVEYGARYGADIVSASPNSFNLRRQSCVNG